MKGFAHEHPVLTFFMFWIGAGTVGTVAWAAATAHVAAKTPQPAAAGIGRRIRQPWPFAR